MCVGADPAESVDSEKRFAVFGDNEPGTMGHNETASYRSGVAQV